MNISSSFIRFETEGLPNEGYIDENGDRLLYSNLYHNHTMDLVRNLIILFYLLLINNPQEQALLQFIKFCGFKLKFFESNSRTSLTKQSSTGEKS